jgi:hypothetical protein
VDTSTVAAQRIIERLRAAFPDDAARADKRVGDQGFGPSEAPYSWVEHFSQLTTDAINGQDFAKAASHMCEVSAILAAGDEEIARCIDVAYVESLMWDITDEKRKREGWKQVPPNLRQLYIRMWGKRPFMKGKR